VWQWVGGSYEVRPDARRPQGGNLESREPNGGMQREAPGSGALPGVALARLLLYQPEVLKIATKQLLMCQLLSADRDPLRVSTIRLVEWLCRSRCQRRDGRQHAWPEAASHAE
jgi:hypothetical protein